MLRGCLSFIKAIEFAFFIIFTFCEYYDFLIDLLGIHKKHLHGWTGYCSRKVWMSKMGIVKYVWEGVYVSVNTSNRGKAKLR